MSAEGPNAATKLTLSMPAVGERLCFGEDLYRCFVRFLHIKAFGVESGEHFVCALGNGCGGDPPTSGMNAELVLI